MIPTHQHSPLQPQPVGALPKGALLTFCFLPHPLLPDWHQLMVVHTSN